MSTQLSAHDVRRVSVTGTVNPRTVTRYLRGGNVRSTCRARIEQALRRLGYASLVRSATAEADRP